MKVIDSHTETRTPSAQIEPARNHRQYSRSARPAGGEISCVRNQDTESDFDGSIIEVLLYPVDEPANGEANTNADYDQVRHPHKAAQRRWRLAA
jgi:hypothetical protein